MSEIKKTREEWLAEVVDLRQAHSKEQLKVDIANYHKLKWDCVLSSASYLPRYRGLKSFFVDNDLRGLKQNFYVASKLLMASQQETTSGVGGIAFAYPPFLYGLLSDSPEICEWLTHTELKNRDYVKGPQFIFHQFQFALRRDDEALGESIELVSKKGGGHYKTLAKEGQDFFSLLLKQDKEGLQALIEDQAKIKSAEELEGQFLAGFAVVHAKLCWYRGIEVQIQNPLVPMALMPIQPLDAYDVEYDFLRPGWTPPPPPGLFAKVKRLFS